MSVDVFRDSVLKLTLPLVDLPNSLLELSQAIVCLVGDRLDSLVVVADVDAVGHQAATRVAPDTRGTQVQYQVMTPSVPAETDWIFPIGHGDGPRATP